MNGGEKSDSVSNKSGFLAKSISNLTKVELLSEFADFDPDHAKD
jgi:hypothetical protein